jgi:taurine dioxygenase
VRRVSLRRGALLNPEARNAPSVGHRLIKTHPETGRKVLYFDPNKLLFIDGLSAQDSDALIGEFNTHMVRPGADYTHKWRTGDIVIWDNRCCYHKAAGDYPPEEDRIHWRVSIRQDVADTRASAPSLS